MPEISPYAVFAFDVLRSKLTGSPSHTLQQFYRVVPKSKSVDVGTDGSFPLFVTWNKHEKPGFSYQSDPNSEPRKELAGCIGIFSALPLERGLREYALIAALEDTRFPPLRKKDLPYLECAVTILKDFEPCQDAYDWEIGTHGIRVAFSYRGRKLGATFLPDVAVEQGWDKDSTLLHLVAKAGLPRHELMAGPSALKNLVLEVTRYKGVKSVATYSEYEKYLALVDKE